MGREILPLGDVQSASDEAEIEYRRALFQVKQGRERFDTRPPSEPPAADTVTLDDISDSLDDQERRMREALNDGEE